MATTLAALASKYDPTSPDYDPSAVPPTSPAPAAATPLNATTASDPLGQAKALTDANKVTATTGTFDETKGVAGRVNDLISGGGSLMQTAQTQAAQESARRGLLKSTQGVQAGEQAVINTATPIANADAALYQQQGLANQTATNAAATTNAQLGVTAGVQGMSLAQQAKQFDVTSGQTQQQIDAQKAQFGQNLDLQQKQVDAQISQFAQTLGLTVQDLALKRDTLSAQQQQALDQLNLQKSQLAQQAQQFSQQAETQKAQFAAQQTQQLVMQNLDAANKERIAGIEAQFKTQIQGSANISQAWGTMMTGIQQIQNNSGLDPATKTTLIKNTTDGFASFANFWQKAGGTDVSDLLNFSVSDTGTAGGSGSTGSTATNGQGQPIDMPSTGGAGGGGGN